MDKLGINQYENNFANQNSTTSIISRVRARWEFNQTNEIFCWVYFLLSVTSFSYDVLQKMQRLKNATFFNKKNWWTKLKSGQIEPITDFPHQVVCPSWPTGGIPFMASTLQIGCYHTTNTASSSSHISVNVTFPIQQPCFYVTLIKWEQHLVFTCF